MHSPSSAFVALQSAPGAPHNWGALHALKEHADLSPEDLKRLPQRLLCDLTQVAGDPRVYLLKHFAPVWHGAPLNPHDLSYEFEGVVVRAGDWKTISLLVKRGFSAFDAELSKSWDEQTIGPALDRE